MCFLATFKTLPDDQIELLNTQIKVEKKQYLGNNFIPSTERNRKFLVWHGMTLTQPLIFIKDVGISRKMIIFHKTFSTTNNKWQTINLF
jgi:hypothetical protein